jgi:hypothetical protein
VNNSQYAVHRTRSGKHCTEGAVRRAIREGRLAGAVSACGDIDADLADKAWRANTMRPAPEPVPPGLARARARQSRARLAALEVQVENLRGSLAPPGLAQQVIDKDLMIVIDGLRGFAGAAAPLVAGQPAGAVECRLDAEVIRLLTELSSDDAPSSPAATTPKPRAEPRSAVEVEERRVTLRAELLEIKNAQRAGELVLIEDIRLALADRLVYCKSSLLALPGRLAAGCAAATPAEAEALIGAEIGSIVTALTVPPIVQALQ